MAVPPPYDDAVAGLADVPTRLRPGHGASDPERHRGQGSDAAPRCLRPDRHPSPGDAFTTDRSDDTLPPASPHLPCVIPQLQGSLNTFAAPFARAYAPSLARHALPPADFLAFLDGLNAAFLAAPVWQGTRLVGAALSQAYGLHAVQLAGGIVQAASGVGSAAVSYARTRAYVRAANERVFHPRGLQVEVLSTARMLRRVGVSGDELPAMESRVGEAGSVSAGAEGARPAEEMVRRRMQRLEGFCAPLEYDVPGSVAPEGWLQRMGHAQAATLTRKHEEKMREEYEKADEKEGKERRDVERERRKVEKKVAKIEEKMAEERAELDRRLASSKVLCDPKERRKVEKKYDEEMQQLQREMEKEREHLVKKEREHGGWNEAEGDAITAPGERSERAKLERKLERKEAKGWKKMRWVVVGAREDALDDGGDGLSEEEEEGGETAEQRLSGR